MTNEEKAQEIGEKCATIAMEMCSCEYECTQSALLMAKWKDEQFEADKQALIDKACEWLKENVSKHLYGTYCFNKGLMLEEFEQAMKGNRG